MSPMQGFAAVDFAAARFELTSGNRFVYPNRSNWKDIQRWPRICPSRHGEHDDVYTALTRAFDRHPSRIVMLRGMPGTGKTFHGLLYGLKWSEEQPAAGWAKRWLGKVSHDARYTAAGYFDEAVVEREFGRRPEFGGATLWIVDEINRLSEDRGRSLIRRFESLGLADAGHRLLLLGTAVPDFASDVGLVEAEVTVESVAAAVQVCQSKYPPSQKTAEWIQQTQLVGLKGILEMAAVVPTAEQQPEGFVRQSVRVALARLTQPASTLLADLALAQFANVPIGASPERASAHQELKDQELAIEEPGTGHWRLVNEEWGPALLRLSVNAVDLPQTLFAPLLAILVRPENTEFLEPAVVTLSKRPASQISGILGVRHACSSERVLELMLAAVGDAFRRTLEVLRMPLPAFAEVVQRIHRFRPAADLAASRLAGDEHAITRAVEACDLPTLLAVSKLAGIAKQQDHYAGFLRAALESPRLADAVRDLELSLHPALLTEAKRLAPGCYQSVRRALLPTDAGQVATALRGRTPTGLWNYFRARLHLFSAQFILEVLQALPAEVVAEALYRRPEAGMMVLRRCFNEKPSRWRGNPWIREVLSVPLKASDIAALGSAEQLVELVHSLRVLEASALQSAVMRDGICGLVDDGELQAARAVARELGRVPIHLPIRRQVVSYVRKARRLDLSTAVYILSILHPREAKARALRRLPSFAASASSREPAETFWAFWNVNEVLTSREERQVLLRAVRQVSTSLPAPSKGAVSYLALVGLLLSISRQRLRVDLPEVPPSLVQNERLETGPIVAGAFYAVSLAPAGRARSHWLAALADSMFLPERTFLTQASPLSHSDRRLISALIRDAFSRLERERISKPWLQDLGDRLASEPLDRFWASRPSTRLQVVIACAGNAAAGQLLERWGEQLVRQISKHGPTSDIVGLLWVSYFLATKFPGPEQTAKALIGAALDSPSLSPQVKDAVTLLARLANVRIKSTPSDPDHKVQGSIEVDLLTEFFTDVSTSKTRGPRVRLDWWIVQRLVETLPVDQLWALRCLLPHNLAGPRESNQADAEIREKAVDAFLRCSPEAWYLLGQSYRRAGLYDQAAAALANGIERNHMRAPREVWTELAIVFDQLGKAEEKRWVEHQGGLVNSDVSDATVAGAQAAIGRRPNGLTAWKALTTALIQTGRSEELFAFAKSLVDVPDARSGIWHVCETCAQTHPHQTAELLELLLSRQPGSEVWTLLGSIYRKLDRHRDAIKACARAARLPHRNAKAQLGSWYALGLAYRDAGRPFEAAKWFRRAAQEGHAKSKTELQALDSVPPNPRSVEQ